MTQPYDERPVAPAAPEDGPHEEAHAEAPVEPPQEAAATEPPTSEAPADDADAPAAPAAAGPDIPESDVAGPDAVEPDTWATDAPDTQERAMATQTDAPTTDGAASSDDEGFSDPRVDDAVARLHDLAGRPVGEHAEVFDDIHQRLRDALEEAAVEPAEEPRG